MENKIPFHANGSSSEPLTLTPAKRHAILLRLNMANGWLILSRDEMNGLRQTMNQCANEVQRLNKLIVRERAARKAEKIIEEQKEKPASPETPPAK